MHANEEKDEKCDIGNYIMNFMVCVARLCLHYAYGEKNYHKQLIKNK